MTTPAHSHGSVSHRLKPARHPLEIPYWGAGSLRDRFEYVRPYVTGKTVLDLGSAVRHHRSDWMHGLIREAAREVVGVDNDQETVALLQREGYDIVFGDAQQLDLGRRFDVVFGGEIIEHLVDFRGFFNGARSHLKADGILILTTPNAFAASNFVYRLWGTPTINPDHTCWFCPDTVRQLSAKCGFEVLECKYVPHRTPGRGRQVLASAVRSILPNRLKWNNLLVVAKPLADADG